MKSFAFLSTVAMALVAATGAQADTLSYNATPNEGWYFGTGNDYSPANSAVLTTGASDQLFLRMHQTYIPAPASDGSGLYSFALGTDPISFDWGIDTASSSVSAMLTLTNIGTGANISYDPFFVGNDNEYQNNAAENSFRLNWAGIGFDPNVNDTYRVNLSVRGLGDGGTHSLSVFAKIGAGAVPEPATWTMMVAGIGLVGASMRRRKTAVSFA